MFSSAVTQRPHPPGPAGLPAARGGLGGAALFLSPGNAPLGDTSPLCWHVPAGKGGLSSFPPSHTASRTRTNRTREAVFTVFGLRGGRDGGESGIFLLVFIFFIFIFPPPLHGKGFCLRKVLQSSREGRATGRGAKKTGSLADVGQKTIGKQSLLLATPPPPPFPSPRPFPPQEPGSRRAERGTQLWSLPEPKETR